MLLFRDHTPTINKQHWLELKAPDTPGIAQSYAAKVSKNIEGKNIDVPAEDTVRGDVLTLQDDGGDGQGQCIAQPAKPNKKVKGATVAP